MAQLGNLIVNGVTRLLSKLYVNGSVTAPEFIGKLTGKADTAGTADKLSVNAGAATQPVYFKDGKPTVTTYGLNKTVPADAKFTDTWRGIQNSLTSTSTTDSLSAAQGKALKDLVDGKAASTHTHTKSQITDFPTLGDASSKTVRTLTAQGPTGWVNSSTDDNYVPTMSFMAYWNGAYSGSSSNLAYCAKGAFGSAATKNTSDFAAASHTHNYAGSSSAGGAATSANKLNANAGSATQPIYFKDGVPVATTYTLGKSVPANANFSDTTYSTFKGATSSAAGGTGLVPAPTAGNQTKYLRADGTWQTPPDTNTTYSNMTAATSDAAGKAGLVPAPAAGAQTKFLRGDGTQQTPTDTNTWRGIQNNLTSTSTTDSLSAAQGKVLKGLVDGKAASNHTHNYAGSSSAGGSATSAVKLDTSTAGSATQPVYFTGGKPSACTYSLGKSVPSDAKFTDTTYSTFKAATSSAAGGSGLVPAPAAGAQAKYLRADGTWQTPSNTWRGVQDNLTSTATNQSLSAAQGKVLKEMIDNVDSEIKAHNISTDSHPDIRATITKLSSSIKTLELKFGTNVTKNPFSVTFETLDDVTVTGVWNVENARIEF